MICSHYLPFLPCLGLLSAFALAPICHAQGRQDGNVTATYAGCKVEARAYVDPSVRDSSRFDIGILNPKEDTQRWEFTLGWQTKDSPNLYRYQGTMSDQSRLPYGKAKETAIQATLWQYDTLEERVTFHNLDLRPLTDEEKRSPATPRFLVLASAVTATTPSGITITLPAQSVKAWYELFSNFNGNPNALFIRSQTTPNQREAVVPLSPLYQKYQKPLQIKMDCDAPNLMVFYTADNTFDSIAVGLPDIATVQHLDTLTLVVRQRVLLQRVPITLHLPVNRPLPVAKK